MDPEKITRRLAEIEVELSSIRKIVAPDAPPGGLGASVQRGVKFVVSHWVLLSCTVALGTAVYVKHAFDIDYFEEYRNQATKKRLSEMHRQLADRMLTRSLFAEAVNSYKEALEVNPHNVAATNGLVKAQVFLPSDPQTLTTPEVTDTKIAYLEEAFPNDHIVSFLKGIRLLDMSKYEEARKHFSRSIELEPSFAQGYASLGYVELVLFDRENSIKHTERAVELDPQNRVALDNLGEAYLVLRQYQRAVDYLIRSDALDPSLSAGVYLGDAYRALGNHDQAIETHLRVLDNATNPRIDKSRYFASEWQCCFMPIATGDTEKIMRYTTIKTQDMQLALVHFSIALDRALRREWDDANREMELALSLEEGGNLRELYANRIAFVQTFERLDGPTKAWLAVKHKGLMMK